MLNFELKYYVFVFNSKFKINNSTFPHGVAVFPKSL